MSIRNDATQTLLLADFQKSLSPKRDSIWLCLYFSKLALDVFDQPDDMRPLAVIEQRHVICANRDNLIPGLAIATAHALYSDLIAFERKPEREHEYLQHLAHWAYQFTPGIVIANCNSLLLEIGSCRRLHRGLHNLLKKIRRSLQQRKQSSVFGLARTPKAAWLLAQCNSNPALHSGVIDDELLKKQLASIPVTTLEIDANAQRALTEMGLTTLGALHALPTAALGKRFGKTFVDYMQKTAGTTADPQLFFKPLPRFQYGLTFIDGVAHRQMLLFPMKRLLQMLDDYLRARQLHCHTLHWQLFDAHYMQAEFSVELSRSGTQNRRNNLLDLSRIKLEQLPLLAAVFSLNLICEDFFEDDPTAQQLFPDENDQHETAIALFDRLQAKLGNNALQRINVQESHWPELAFCFDSPTILHRRSAPQPYHRPPWLLAQPQLLTQRNGKIIWQTPLTLLRGPERIGNHWWQEADNERDYYIASNTRGVICWIYRERDTQQWFLHGLF